MSKKPWFPFYVADYRADTQHLTYVEHGAYQQLILAYYESGGPLPRDERKLLRMCNCQTRYEAQVLNRILKQFFTPTESTWTHKRMDAELQRSKQITAIKSENARRNSSVDRKPIVSQSTYDRKPIDIRSTYVGDVNSFRINKSLEHMHTQSQSHTHIQSSGSTESCSYGEGFGNTGVGKRIPPAREDVKAFCEARKSTVNADYFWEYYERRGWVMKVHWTTKVIDWEGNGIENRGRVESVDEQFARVARKMGIHWQPEGDRLRELKN